LTRVWGRSPALLTIPGERARTSPSPASSRASGIVGDGDAFWLDGTQIAHWRDPWTLEIRLTKRLISERRAE